MAARQLLKDVYIVGGKRTPFGAYGKSLAKMNSTQLAVVAANSALQQANLKAADLDNVVVGNCIADTAATPYIARHTALHIGCPLDTPSLTINRLCGSGFQSVINIANDIELGISRIGLAAGSESMSGAPHSLFGGRFGVKLGTDLKLVDCLWAGLTDQNIKTPMGVTAENLAEKYDISREDADNYALRTQQRWGQAQAAGIFNKELAPISIKVKGKDVEVFDEHARPDVTMGQMAKLPTVFKKNGTVTPGNASGVCDGAGAVILAGSESVKNRELEPIARLVGYSIVGVDPTIMGIGPVPAIENLLKVCGLNKNDVGIYDINEAFAPQFLACEKALGLDPEKTNVCGGAIALGHPLAASGSRITAHLAHMLHVQNQKYAIGSACIGGGQGIAVLLERC